MIRVEGERDGNLGIYEQFTTLNRNNKLFGENRNCAGSAVERDRQLASKDGESISSCGGLKGRRGLNRGRGED